MGFSAALAARVGLMAVIVVLVVLRCSISCGVLDMDHEIRTPGCSSALTRSDLAAAAESATMQGFARAAQADLRSVSGGLQASQFPGQLVVPFHERFEFQCGESPFAYHHPPIDHGPGGLRAGTQQQGAHGIVHRTTGKAQGAKVEQRQIGACLLYTSPSPRDGLLSRMPSSA